MVLWRMEGAKEQKHYSRISARLLQVNICDESDERVFNNIVLENYNYVYIFYYAKKCNLNL